MRRRRVLKSIGTGGLLTIGVGGVSGRESGGVSVTDLDAIHVERDGEVIATLENPSESNLRQLHSATDSTEELVTPEECCLKECESDCIYCDYGCCDGMYDC